MTMKHYLGDGRVLLLLAQQPHLVLLEGHLVGCQDINPVRLAGGE